ncbi:MAG: hypothetical protein IDH49_15530 [Gammaproteobacteria bacterium]|nr:hypothetical protein [Gammaproteobacteria bacterium]
MWRANPLEFQKSHFLGVIAQVYKRVEQGGIRIVNIPTQQLPVAEIDQMIDLGIVFKAETIKECVEHYVNVVNASTSLETQRGYES